MDHETTVVSTCCGAKACEQSNEVGFWEVCKDCGEVCTTKEVCAYCFGTGEVDVDERDSDGNIEHGVGTRKCVCKLTADDYE